ncbi:hypothetical protein NL529_29110, partial [Klebsiella pneumoniae]|nr:hypothetical protein [Klebsiella pneumoniae]
MFRVSESQMDNSGRVTISPGSAGNYILGVYQGSGMLGAAIGESNQSGGFVQVNDFQTSGVILNGPAHAVQV